jgi:hypothetical protein
MLASPTTQLIYYPGGVLFTKLIRLTANILAISGYFAYLTQNIQGNYIVYQNGQLRRRLKDSVFPAFGG